MDNNRRQLLIAATATATTAAAAALSGCARSTGSSKLAQPLPRIEGFRGRVIERGQPAYEDWRSAMVWQMRKPPRSPEFIVRPGDEADVRAAVRFAAREQLQVSARSGGHHIWAASVRDGGMLLDLSQFRRHQVEDGGVASFGPSIWARDIMLALAPHGQAFPVAHCATVPLGGYILGGGLGINGDAWDGMACNALLGGRVMTASGDLLEVSPADNPDLLWAMRGGGGGLPFVVTDMTVKTYDRPQGALTATYLYPLAMLEKALDLLDQIESLSPGQTELLALMLHNPSAPADAPPEMQKAIAVRVQVYGKTPEQATKTIDAVAALPPAAHAVFKLGPQEESFEKLFVDSMDWRRGFGFGRFAVENAWVAQRREAVTAVAERFQQAPSWKSHVVIQPKLRPAVDGSGAFSAAADTYIGLYSVWDQGPDDPVNVRWLKETSAVLDRFSRAHYVNEIDARENPQRLKKCFSEDNWARLRSLRQQWDPGQVLHDFPGLS